MGDDAGTDDLAQTASPSIPEPCKATGNKIKRNRGPLRAVKLRRNDSASWVLVKLLQPPPLEDSQASFAFVQCGSQSAAGEGLSGVAFFGRLPGRRSPNWPSSCPPRTSTTPSSRPFPLAPTLPLSLSPPLLLLSLLPHSTPLSAKPLPLHWLHRPGACCPLVSLLRLAVSQSGRMPTGPMTPPR